MGRCTLIIASSLLIGFTAGTAPAQWVDSLPPEVIDSILWVGDHEEASLYDWDYGGDPDAGGGVFNTGPDEDIVATATDERAHSGAYSAVSIIRNAFQAQNGNRAVRLMRWTNTHWAKGGEYFPDQAYYSAWYYFPHTYNPNKYDPWDPGDGGWWNIFQFKADDIDGVSQPVFTLNVDHNDATQEMSLYLYSKLPENTPNSFDPIVNLPIPVGQWVHLEAFYSLSPANTGHISIWQDGTLVLDVSNVVTVMPGGEEQATWGIGNYTNHIDGGPVPGEATIYFDDAVVSTMRISAHLCPADSDDDGTVGATDLLNLLAAWGAPGCAGNLPCTVDLNFDGSVDVVDLIDMLSAWGDC